jgi:Heterokaryon incompatibility protein Het-C
MKNYIANERGGWTTSTRYIRESLRRAVQLGRQSQYDERAMCAALRLLGQVMLQLFALILVAAYTGGSQRAFKLD